MFLRIDKLGVELPPSKFDPTAAAAVQELLGGRFGEMSTLNNYLHQSTAMRAKKQLGPFYELVASITAEEVGHVELVATTINALLDQAPDSADPNKAPFEDNETPRINQHFIAGGPGHLVANSQGAPWSGRLRLQFRQPRDGPAAQLLPGDRREITQGARLRDDVERDGADDDRLPAGARRRAPGGLRARAGKADRRADDQDAAGAEHRQQEVQVTRGHGSGRASTRSSTRSARPTTRTSAASGQERRTGPTASRSRWFRDIRRRWPTRRTERPIRPGFSPNYDPAEMFEIAKRLMKNM